MAFNSSLLRLWDSGGLTQNPPLSTSSSEGTPNVWAYSRSSDSSTDLSQGAYLTGVGMPTILNRNAGYGSGGGLGNLGVRIGDVLVSCPSTLASNPRCTWHLVIGSTPDISTSLSSFYFAKYNCTLSGAT